METPVVKLTGNNWATWKFHITVILKSKEVYEVVVGDLIKPDTDDANYAQLLKVFTKKDVTAQEIIICRLDENVISHILSCESAFDIWKKLLTVFERKSEISIHLLQQKFFNLHFNPHETVSSFLSRVEEITSAMACVGDKFSDSMIITRILMALPPSFGHFISAWESVPSDKQTVTNLMARLLIEEERADSQTELSDSAAFMTLKKEKSRERCSVCGKMGHSRFKCFKLDPSNQPSTSNGSSNWNRDKIRCHFCNKVGHVKKNCFKFKNQKQEKKVREEAFMVSSVFNKTHINDINTWYLDTGASEHMCCQIDFFENFEYLSHKKPIKFGDEKVLFAIGLGTIKLVSYISKNECVKITLKEVLFVPEMQVNLFSVGSALDKGYTMSTNQFEAKILNSKNEVSAIAVRCGKLYKMNFLFDGDQSIVMVADEKNNLLTWHEKMAHQNIKQVERVLKINDVRVVQNSNFFCESCILSKQIRKSFKSSNTKSSKVGEIIHADLCGPMEVNSLGGSKYFLLIKDDYSHYRFVYFLKYKNEVYEHLKNFISLYRNIRNEMFKVIRTDCGTEFLNYNCENLLSELGIVHEKTVPYCPEQNGKIEREMRTVVESARSMLASSGLGKHLWAEAVNCAVYVLNKTGTSSVSNKTPYTLWTNKIFDINILKVFGSDAYIHIPKQSRKKWDLKSKKGIFVGYSLHTKGYRIYLPDENKVEISCNVVFHPIPEENKNVVPKVIKHYDCLFPNIDEEVVIDINTVHLGDLQGEENIDENDQIMKDISEEQISETYSLRDRGSLKRPERFDDFEIGMLCIMEIGDPESYEEAINSESSNEWKKAMEEELRTLKENRTWTKVKRPPDISTIDCKWVYKTKKNKEGVPVLYKARLVARGFQQRESFNLEDIYAPVAKLSSLRVLLALANSQDLYIHQMDVTSAFLNGDISETVYLTVPQGLDISTDYVLKLEKSIYGLKKSPKNWNVKFNEAMIKEGFARCVSDSCLFFKFDDHYVLYILLYVDDLLLIGNNESEIERFKIKLSVYFKMKDLGTVSSYLGINISHDLNSGVTKLNQTTYLKNVLKIFGMTDCNAVSTPMDPNFKLSLINAESSDEKQEHRCRKLIGCLMYAMTGTRPDLCFPVSFLSRFQSQASEELWVALKRVLRYIKGTVDLCLVYTKGDQCLKGYADADWAGDLTERKSTSGYLFQVGPSTVVWSSKKQRTVALSSTEAEYIALSCAVTEACWLKNLFNELNLKQFSTLPVKIFEDNQSTIRIASSAENKRTKHVDVRYHFLKEKVNDGTISLHYVSSQSQLADILTKPLGKQCLERLRDQLGLK